MISKETKKYLREEIASGELTLREAVVLGQEMDDEYDNYAVPAKKLGISPYQLSFKEGEIWVTPKFSPLPRKRW